MLKSKKNNLPEKDGSKRSVKEYAGGGKTGYSMIGMEKPMMMYGCLLYTSDAADE